jgi:DnaJ domain
MPDENGQIDAMRIQIKREKKALAILGLNMSWSIGQIKRAWRQKVFRVHPDRNQGNETAQRKVILLTCAYKYLIDGKGGTDLDGVDINNEIVNLDNDCRSDEREYNDWWKNNYF